MLAPAAPVRSFVQLSTSQMEQDAVGTLCALPTEILQCILLAIDSIPHIFKFVVKIFSLGLSKLGPETAFFLL